MSYALCVCLVYIIYAGAYYCKKPQRTCEILNGLECVWLIKRDGGKMSMMRVVSDVRAKRTLDYYKSDVL